MPVTTQFIDDGYYGVDNNVYTTVENVGSLSIKNRTLTNDKGVSISLNAIDDYGHWNYEPTAAEMWKFFSQYSRDMNTGEIVLNKKDYNTNKPENNESTPTVKPNETTDDKKNDTSEDKKKDDECLNSMIRRCREIVNDDVTFKSIFDSGKEERL